VSSEPLRVELCSADEGGGPADDLSCRHSFLDSSIVAEKRRLSRTKPKQPGRCRRHRINPVARNEPAWTLAGGACSGDYGVERRRLWRFARGMQRRRASPAFSRPNKNGASPEQLEPPHQRLGGRGPVIETSLGSLRSAPGIDSARLGGGRAAWWTPRSKSTTASRCVSLPALNVRWMPHRTKQRICARTDTIRGSNVVARTLCLPGDHGEHATLSICTLYTCKHAHQTREDTGCVVGLLLYLFGRYLQASLSIVSEGDALHASRLGSSRKIGSM